jgi:hypothetical protein
MLRLYIPVVVTLALIGSLTVWEGLYSDRWSKPTMTAEEFGKRFEKLPKTVGPWVGEDYKVDEKTLQIAGAVNHVSRTYVNSDTNEKVELWLIVGHTRDVGRHTPDVCYPSQGFQREGDVLKQPIDAPGEEPASFFTARFRDETRPQAPRRVFWAWSANNSEKDDVKWESPDYVRLRYGHNRALYKMYFTADMPDKNQKATDSPAYQFAMVMLPVVNRALYPERYPTTADEAANAAGAGGEEPAAKADIESTMPKASSLDTAPPAKAATPAK